MKIIKDKFLSILDTYFKQVDPDGMDKVLETIDELFQMTGACEKCYGKGYTTVDAMAFCDCERGQTLQKLLTPAFFNETEKKT